MFYNPKLLQFSAAVKFCVPATKRVPQNFSRAENVFVFSTINVIRHHKDIQYHTPNLDPVQHITGAEVRSLEDI